MQTIFGIICIAVGVFGMAVYPLTREIISREEQIGMLLGLAMTIFGFIIIYGDRKKKRDKGDDLNIRQ
jgi:hypothetical protein